jgi:hypothetical protein
MFFFCFKVGFVSKLLGRLLNYFNVFNFATALAYSEIFRLSRQRRRLVPKTFRGRQHFLYALLQKFYSLNFSSTFLMAFLDCVVSSGSPRCSGTYSVFIIKFLNITRTRQSFISRNGTGI